MEEDAGGRGGGHRHWETMVEEECGEEALRFGGFPSPARGSAARLDWDPCTKSSSLRGAWGGQIRRTDRWWKRGLCVWREGLYPRSCTCSHCAKREKKAGEI